MMWPQPWNNPAHASVTLAMRLDGIRDRYANIKEMAHA